MKEARYLIRLAHDGQSHPKDHGAWLSRVRALVQPLDGKAINLRVAPRAIEFDLFCAPDADVTPYSNRLSQLGPVLTCKRLDVPPAHVDAERIVSEARMLFNEQRFWEVHETLEGLWRQRSGKEKQLLQGLILIAAALVHVQKNEMKVVWPMLREALGRLEGQPEHYFGWPVEKFRERVASAVAHEKIDFPTV